MAQDRTRLVKYEKLRLLGMNKSKAAVAAGYSRSTDSYTIEKSNAYKDMKEETLRAAQDVNVTPATVLSTLKRSMDRNKTDSKADSTANQAAKIAADVLGMAAPQVVQTEVVTKQNVLIGILQQITQGDPYGKQVTSEE